jgi:hypothetical protein
MLDNSYFGRVDHSDPDGDGHGETRTPNPRNDTGTVAGAASIKKYSKSKKSHSHNSQLVQKMQLQSSIRKEREAQEKARLWLAHRTKQQDIRAEQLVGIKVFVLVLRYFRMSSLLKQQQQRRHYYGRGDDGGLYGETSNPKHHTAERQLMIRQARNVKDRQLQMERALQKAKAGEDRLQARKDVAGKRAVRTVQLSSVQYREGSTAQHSIQKIQYSTVYSVGCKMIKQNQILLVRI